MAILPSAGTSLSESSNAFGSGTDYVVVMSCVAQSADYVPRVVSSTSALLTQYGYAPGVDYCALHFQQTKKPVIFVGLPIATPGWVGCVNTTGVTGTSNISFSVGASGAMDEAEISVTVASVGAPGVLQGTVGVSQIVLSVSCDGGQSNQLARVGTATSYTIPYLGITINLGGGTLNVGDTATAQSFAPMWGSTAIATAQASLAAQQFGQRSWLVVGDLPNATFGGYVVTSVNNYETEDDRFVYARAQVQDRLPLGTKAQIAKQMTGAPGLVFAASGHTITREDSGSFVTDGFVVGDGVTAAGTTSNNGFIGVLTAVSATELTFASGVVNETDAAGVASLVASSVLTFVASGDTITRSSGSWLTDGFEIGDVFTIAGTQHNNTSGASTLGPITALSATVLTVTSGITNEGPIASSSVSIEQSYSFVSWISTETAAFASIAAQKRVDLAIGKGFATSPIMGWSMRRGASWAASLREFTKDLQVATYRKSDGPLNGFAITDAANNIVEFDERVIGGALAGLFTCMRSYANGPLGAFIALSLTRDTDNATLSRTQNMAVANLAQTIIQGTTENMIGAVLVLNADGTGTDASLGILEGLVNDQLQINLLQSNGPDGPRSSVATWSASRTDILNVVGATLHGTGNVELDGTLEQIATAINVN